MALETDLSTGVSETSKVEIEEKNGLSLSSCEDQEKVGEVLNDNVCDSEGKSEGEEVKSEGESSYVFISSDKPLLESDEEKHMKNAESDDSCKVESDSCAKQDIAVDDIERNEETIITGTETLKPEGENMEDDDEKIEETKLDKTVEMESVQLELHQLDNLNSTQKNDDEEKKLGVQDILDSEAEIGDNQDSQSTCVETVENNDEVIKNQDSEVLVSEHFDSTKSEDHVPMEESSPFLKDEGEGSYVFVSSDSIVQKNLELVEENPVLEGNKPLLESDEYDDSCKVESDSSAKQDGTVESSLDKIEGNTETITMGTEILKPEGEHLENNEKIEETKLDNTSEMESVQPELHQLDNLSSTQKNDDDEIKSGEQDMLDSEVEIGDNHDSQSICMPAVENYELESAGEVIKNPDSEVLVSEYFDSTKSEDYVPIEEPPRLLTEEKGLELEMGTCPVTSTQLEEETTDCFYKSGDSLEVTDEEAKENGNKGGDSSEATDEEAKEDGNSSSHESSEVTDVEAKEDGDSSSHESSEVTDVEAKDDGDSSYVFVDGVDVVSDDPAERETFTVDVTKLRSVYPHVVVGSVVCGLHPTSVPITEISPCSVDDGKSENELADKGECLPTGPNNDALTESEVMNDSSEFESNESVSPVGDVYLESDVGSGSTLSNRESTPSSNADTSDEKKVDEKIERKPIFRYLIKVPRYIDDKIGEQIGLVQLQVDETTRRRDAIRVEVQQKRVTCNEYRDKLEAAKSEVRAAYDALDVKREDMNSVQSTLNRIKNAISIEEIGNRIHSMQHRIEHETIHLKEEKQLIREMKQLKLHRQQLCSILDRQAEMQPGFDQKEELEKRLKLLKQDLDSARNQIMRTEGITEAARKIYFNENEKLRNMQSQFRSADVLRQKAYAHLQNLKKQLYDKNKYFRIYKDGARKAEDYGFSGDREALHCHCVNQVEKVMELWNNNDDFRNEYLRCNTVSTVRRLGTLDGRSLGPGEDPPILRKFVGDKVAVPFVDKVAVTPAASTKMNSMSSVSTLEQRKSVLPLRTEKAEEKSAVNQKQKHEIVQSKQTIPFVLENRSPTVSSKVELEEKTEEENKQTQEEEELAKKEEVLRKEAAAAKIREQHLLEERAKAKEAEERKRRNAEKVQARAELKTQKEAEHKEKEKAKRERRKARKNATKGISEKESSFPPSESTILEPTPLEPENEDKPKTMPPRSLKPEAGEKQPKTVSKRPQKPKQAMTKVVVPPSLRNKNKKRMQLWMWVLFTALVVLAGVIFLLLPSLRPMLL